MANLTIVFDLVDTDNEENIQEFHAFTSQPSEPAQQDNTTDVRPKTQFKFRFGNGGKNEHNEDDEKQKRNENEEKNVYNDVAFEEPIKDLKNTSQSIKKFGPSKFEERKMRSVDTESDLEEDSKSDTGFDKGLWFKGHTPQPSDSEGEEENGRSQINKLLTYEHEFALPLACEPYVLNNKRSTLLHNEYSFDETDFSQHRKGAQPFQLAKNIVQKKHHSSSKHRRHHSSRHSSSRHKEKQNINLDILSSPTKEPLTNIKETVGGVIGDSPSDKNKLSKITDVLQKLPKIDTNVDLRPKKDVNGPRPKSSTICTYTPTGTLPPVSESNEGSEKDVGALETRRLSLQDNLVVPTPTNHRRRKHEHRHNHKKHHHARHLQHKQVTLNSSLEMRIRSGMQTLEEERKAIREIVTEIEGELDQKDIDDMTSHRFGHFYDSSRHGGRQKRHMKSGMSTHMSDVDSMCSVKPQKPHMHIDMEENQLALIPREGFVELEELVMNEEGGELQWKERARWIKFEEDIEKNERWGKPHVASLSFQSLLELRRGIEQGTVLLNLDNYDLPTIFESAVDNMIITDQIPTSSRDRIIGILLSKHCHHHQNRSSLRRRLSVSSVNSLRRSETSVNSLKTKDSGIDNEFDVDEDSMELTKVTKEMEVYNLMSHGLAVGVENNDTKSHNHHDKMLVHQDEFDNGIDKIRSVDDYFDKDVNVLKKAETVIRFAPVTEEPKGAAEPKSQSDVKDRVPIGAEATSVLVATLDDLSRPAMAFVRLAKGCYLGNLTEVVIPVRFLFIIMGPPTNHDYYEIGRSIATLMSDKVFHDLAYSAKNRDDLLAAINSFLDDSIVLAPGDWDRHLLLPLLQAEITEKKKERIKLLKKKAHLDVPEDEQPFLRTGKLFGGLVRDIKNKFVHYPSDFSDGFNLRCFISIIFIFFATLAPTITFGAMLSKKTDKNLGVVETLLATSLCGVIFSLTSGQPLMIVGTTGPILVFEQATYDLCNHFSINFLVWRFWIGMMVMIITWAVVAFEGCFLVEYFTRFTEEIFSVLISFLFIYEAISFLFKTLQTYSLNIHKDVYIRNTTYLNTSIANYSLSGNQSSYVEVPHACESQNPNIFLISILLMIGTYFIASWLRKLRFSHFLSSKTRRVLSDFGVPIAMIVMVGLNYLHDVKDVPKIVMPHSFRPTLPSRESFFINPINDLSIKWMALSILPAICVSILLFMETELTGVLLNKRKNKLKKGGGYNLDLFVMGALTGLCSALGLPWMCAATVQSVQHQNALAIMSRSHAPGERPYLLHIKEQRLTNLGIHVLMAIFTIFYEVIQSIPIAVCFGVFIYLGITSLSGIQFIEQIELIFVPSKFYPNRKYVRCVKQRSMVMYTMIQLGCLLCLIAIKLTPVAPGFPFFIIGMVFLRRFIERYFTEDELEDLDNEDDDDEFDEFDEYGIQLPM